MIVESLAEKNVLINGIDINYRTLGQGMPFLILHGWGSRSEKWQEVGRMIAEKGFKVIIPDLPGFGKSQEPNQPWNLDDYSDFLNSFIKNMGINNFYLLGHSFGGAISAKYTSLNQGKNKIEKLFLVGASCFRERTYKHLLLKFLAKLFNFLSFLPFYNLLRRGFYKYLVRKSDYLAAKGVMRQTYLNIIEENFSEQIKSIAVPTVLIWGDKDDIIPLKLGLKLNKVISHSKMIVIKGGDHDLERKMPEILAQKILDKLI